MKKSSLKMKKVPLLLQILALNTKRRVRIFEPSSMIASTIPFKVSPSLPSESPRPGVSYSLTNFVPFRASPPRKGPILEEMMSVTELALSSVLKWQSLI